MRLPTRRQFLKGTAAFFGTAATVGLYAWQVEPRWVSLVRRRLPIAGLPPALEGKTLLQLTDVHVGPLVDDDYVLGVFRDIARLAPDIIVHTGDWTTFHDEIVPQAERIYARMPRGRLATLGVLGNHDYGHRWLNGGNARAIVGMARDAAGCRILRNEVAEVEGLQIVGLDDLWASAFYPEKAMRALDPARPMLALTHNPDTVDLNGWGPFRGWILAGHTHGGQVRPPFRTPPVIPVRNKRYTSGTFALAHERTMYISRGVGYTLQVRFNARPEVTLFTLARA
jgi:predicted MPP superfamily phosphohydrolase